MEDPHERKKILITTMKVKDNAAVESKVKTFRGDKRCTPRRHGHPLKKKNLESTITGAGNMETPGRLTTVAFSFKKGREGWKAMSDLLKLWPVNIYGKAFREG